ncbi:hypothetical protein R1CP_40475 (plasmid) [Rhodococcus opacus]|uniref:Uncharacterized protein n=1 Tax=Rhodococcus opacus TaxID=37919 RepID=A0A1B1KJ88_RHOOP|nr:hypothetical protein R1CP_40475 [Rhodococcus opacus]
MICRRKSMALYELMPTRMTPVSVKRIFLSSYARSSCADFPPMPTVPRCNRSAICSPNVRSRLRSSLADPCTERPTSATERT